MQNIVPAHSSDCVKEMQRAFSSNGWYSKSKEFQKETALRAVRFELCLCKAVCLSRSVFNFLGGGENIRINKVKMVEPDRQGEREFTNRPESKERKRRGEGAVGWKARK